MIRKAKVYIKNPADAPPGVKLQEGKRGGQYYMSDDMERSKPKVQQVKNRVETLSVDSQKFANLMEIMDAEDDVKSAEPISLESINALIKKYNIDLDGATLNLLPVSMNTTMGFVTPNDPNNIYLTSVREQEYVDYITDLKDILSEEGYTKDELNFSIEDRKASVIIHETGHTKVHRFINLKDIPTQDEFQKVEYTKSQDYILYLIKYYGVPLPHVYEKLDEILAEDYRQIVGGSQSKLPNRYLYPLDTIASTGYKYKEGRLDILRKMGVF